MISNAVRNNAGNCASPILKVSFRCPFCDNQKRPTEAKTSPGIVLILPILHSLLSDDQTRVTSGRVRAKATRVLCRCLAHMSAEDIVAHADSVRLYFGLLLDNDNVCVRGNEVVREQEGVGAMCNVRGCVTRCVAVHTMRAAV